MNEQTKQNALDTAIRHATDILRENWPDAMKACGAAAIEAARHEKDSFKFKIGVVVIVEPRGDECIVNAELAYGLRRKDSTEPKNVGPMPLFERKAEKDA